MNLPLYFGGVFLALLTFCFALGFGLRAAKWKPKPIKTVWSVLIIVGAVFVGGLVCSVVGEDIHILYWSLLGIPIFAVGLMVSLVFVNLFMLMVTTVLSIAFGKAKPKK
ncbi:MAG: hypothetical protein WCN95_04085 [bacterium]